jgi:hypothetical protein
MAAVFFWSATVSWLDEDFFSAFSDAGMLDAATYLPEAGPAVPFNVGFNRPDEVILDGVAMSTQYSIEYQAAAVVLKRNSLVQIKGVIYKVLQPPSAKGDGRFMVAFLEKVTQ